MEELTEALSGDKGQDSKRGEPIKGIARKHRSHIAAFTCDLEIEEQERLDSFHEQFKWCIEEFKKSGIGYSKKAGCSSYRMKYILETERDWFRKNSIRSIQDKVMKFENN